MYRNVLLCIVVVVVAINNISPVKAFNGENADRQLRSVQTPTKENHFSDDEERANLKDLATKVKTDKLDDLVAKAKTGQVDDAIAAAGGNNWQQTLGKMKANNFKNIDDIKAPAVNQNMWQAAVAKIQSGKLNKLDTTNSKWKSAFNKLKTNDKLKNVDEAQVVKVTEGVAKEIAKAPAKSSKFKKFLEITFGVAVTALVVIGFNAMAS